MENKMTGSGCHGRTKLFLTLSSIFFLILFAPSRAITANPEPIGRMEIISLTDFAGNAGALASKISPNLQPLPFLAIIALTLNPEYRALDFSDPISVFIYPHNAKFIWAAAVSRNGDMPLPLEVKFIGGRAFVKKAGDRAVLSYSRELLNSINKLPPLLATADDNNASTILLTLDMAQYLKQCGDDYVEFRQKYIDSALLKNLENNHGKNSAEKAMQTVAETEKFIRQISKLSVVFNVQPDYIDALFTIEPAPGSDLSDFIAKQDRNAVKPMPVVKNKSIAATVDMESAPLVIRRLPGLIAEFQDNSQLPPDTKNLLTVLASAIDKRFSYYADLENGSPVFFLKTESKQEKNASLKKMLDAGGIKPDSSELYCIQTCIKDKVPAVYCKIYYDSIAIISGDIDAKKASELLKESETPDCLQSLENVNIPLQIFIRHEKELNPSSAVVAMKNHRIIINVRINPLLVKKFIPAVLLEKSDKIKSSFSN